MHLRSREHRLRGASAGIAVAAVLMLASAPLIASQAPAGQASAPPGAASARALQPPLDVDRDPIPSPDPDPAPPPAGSTAPTIPLGTIARGSGGRYTLREDAYE